MVIIKAGRNCQPLLSYFLNSSPIFRKVGEFIDLLAFELNLQNPRIILC